MNRARDWPGLLRGGIRGATESEILRILRSSGDGYPTVMQPIGMDRAAYWLSLTKPHRYRLPKRAISSIFRVTDKVLGTVPSMQLDVAIRKDPARRMSADERLSARLLKHR